MTKDKLLELTLELIDAGGFTYGNQTVDNTTTMSLIINPQFGIQMMYSTNQFKKFVLSLTADGFHNSHEITEEEASKVANHLDKYGHTLMESKYEELSHHIKKNKRSNTIDNVLS